MGGKRRGRTGAHGAVVSASSTARGGVLRGGGEDNKKETSTHTGKLPTELLKDWSIREKRIRAHFKKTPAGATKCIVPAGRKGEPRGSKNEPQAVVGIGEDEELAALAVLAEVESGKPLHRILPSKYRSSWQELGARRARREEQIDEQIEQAKTAEEKRKRREKTSKRVVEVSLHEKSRMAIEDAVIASTNYATRGEEDNGSDASQVEALTKRLVRLGFASNDAEVAVQRTGGHYEASLDWLCLNLDESELPKSFAPKGDIVVIRDGNIVDAELASDLAKLVATSKMAAERALRLSKNDPTQALYLLFETVVGRTGEAPADEGKHSDCLERRNEEVEALVAIYGEESIQTVRIGVRGWFAIRVRLSGLPSWSGRVEIDFIDAVDRYPSRNPVISVSGDRMPASTRRAFMRAAVMEMRRSRATTEPVVNDIISYLLQTDLDGVFGDAKELAYSLDQAPAAARNVEAKCPTDGDRTSRDAPRKSAAGTPGLRKKKWTAPKPSEEIMKKRRSLPAWHRRGEVASRISENRVVVISGATGSGKTTQVPQFILDETDRATCDYDFDSTFIVVTQPRRLAAVSVAQRVARERGQTVGEDVGYQVRLDSKVSRDTRLVFCTTGVLLRRLQNDHQIRSITHVIVDEVHERSIETDILLLLLREVLQFRRDLRIVLMSATLDAEKFVQYFADASSSTFGPVPSVTIEGRAFPVEENFLEDALQLSGYVLKPGDMYTRRPKKDEPPPPPGETPYERTLRLLDEAKVNFDLIEHLVEAIDRSAEEPYGSILVFVPGIADVNALVSRLSGRRGSLFAVPLHALLSPEDQARAFNRPPKGMRKVVCSTNVAETSVTVEDVVYVVDTVRAKISGFDALNGASVLEEQFISKASAKQRAGRAGRVRAGVCYRLVKRGTFVQLRNADEPELRRSSLDRTCLTVLATLDRDPREILALALDPPKRDAIRAALDNLVSLGAMTEGTSSDAQRKVSELETTVRLTALGAHLAVLPADVRVGKLLIYGSLFGCADSSLSIAAAMAERMPFPNSEVKSSFNWGKSDLLALARLFERYRKSESQKKFCEANGISRRTMSSMASGRKLLSEALRDIGFDPENDVNRDSLLINKAVLCAALYPNVVRVDAPPQKYRAVAGGSIPAEGRTEPRELKLRLKNGSRVFLDRNSVNFNESALESGWLAFSEKSKRGEGHAAKLLLRDSTMVPPFALLLFGGKITVKHERGLIVVDDWIEFAAPAKVGVLVAAVREKLDELLWSRIRHTVTAAAEKDTLDSILDLIRNQG